MSLVARRDMIDTVLVQVAAAPAAAPTAAMIVAAEIPGETSNALVNCGAMEMVQ